MQQAHPSLLQQHVVLRPRLSSTSIEWFVSAGLNSAVPTLFSVQELSTIALPQAFLPLACTANLAKNLAAVAASSTRAPIYKTFALQNNLAGA